MLTLRPPFGNSLSATHISAQAKTIAAQYRVEIIRDDYGVPHIYGARDADVAFGLAYAHAQDDFETMQGLIPFYRGQLGRSLGLDGLPIDYLIEWLNVRDNVAQNLDTQLTPALRAHLQAYADGVNYYAAQHPGEIDPAYFPMTLQDVATGFSLQHLLFYGFERHVTELFADSPQRELAHPPADSPLSQRWRDPHHDQLAPAAQRAGGVV